MGDIDKIDNVALSVASRFDVATLRAEVEACKTALDRAALRVRRFNEFRALGDMAWFAQAIEVHALATDLVMTNGGGPTELWRVCVDANYTWEQFVKDQLELSAEDASQMKNVVAVFLVDLGWSLGDLMTVGRSKLRLMLGEMRRNLLSTGQPDWKLVNLARYGVADEEIPEPNVPTVFDEEPSLTPATYVEIQDYLVQKRPGHDEVARLALDLRREPENYDGEEFEIFDLTLWNRELPHAVGSISIPVRCPTPADALSELMERIVARLDGLEVRGWKEKE